MANTKLRTLTIEVPQDLMNENVLMLKDIAAECINLYALKNKSYGNSFGEGYKKLGKVYAIGRIYDKVNRLVQLVQNPVLETFDESFEDTLIDLACYSLMTLVEEKSEHNKEKDQDE